MQINTNRATHKQKGLVRWDAVKEETAFVPANRSTKPGLSYLGSRIHFFRLPPKSASQNGIPENAKW
jgi:hypothetical protein